METKHSDAKGTKYLITWTELVKRKLDMLERVVAQDKYHGEKIKAYGIPRGGSVVAAMLDCFYSGKYFAPVETWEEADIIVDDIRGSGKTSQDWVSKTDKQVFVLVDKLTIDKDIGWVVFPWELADESSGPSDAIVRLLEFVGEDPNREGLVDTPTRVIKAFEEMTSGYKMDIKKILGTTFDIGTKEMIILNNIRFSSLCEHHLLPFSGTCSVGYLPNPHRVVGISKLARVVELYSKRLQVQEILTNAIAYTLDAHLQPFGVGVVIKAHHQCMGCRGVKQPDAEMVTSAMLGKFRQDQSVRMEFLKLIGG